MNHSAEYKMVQRNVFYHQMRCSCGFTVISDTEDEARRFMSEHIEQQVPSFGPPM